MSSLLVFFWGGVEIFEGSESDQKQNVKLLQNMVYNTTQHPPPHSHILYVLVYILYVYFGKGGGVGEGREKVEGQQFTRGVENQHD
jgi:hypothetical protein